MEAAGGVLTADDLRQHKSTFDDPISVTFEGKTVYEMPPNGQGITALLALNILKHVNLKGLEHNSAAYLHRLVEAMRLAFADSLWYVTDPAVEHIPIDQLLSEVNTRVVFYVSVSFSFLSFSLSLSLSLSFTDQRRL